MIDILENISIAPYTTLKIGGVADYFFEAKDQMDLVAALNFAKEKDVPYFLLGGGSNVLFSDGGYRGLVIVNHAKNIRIEEESVSVESGFSLAELVQKTTAEHLQGLETLAGIPGTVGGAVRGNAGTRGGEIGEKVTTVKVWRDGDVIEVPHSECDFEYRHSAFKENKDVILEIMLKLDKTDQDLSEVVKHTLIARANKQPKGMTCGSFFKNPSTERSAGELIDLCGLKGTQIGGAKISEMHGNWIVNNGGASSEDVIKLKELAQEKVKEKFGVELMPEVEIIK